MKKAITREESEQSLYDSDFYEWTQKVSECLVQGRLSKVDLEHVAEEIADMGKRDRRELKSRMTVLIMHLMKWAVQPDRRERSTWTATIIEQRNQIHDLLEDSPSLRVHLVQELPVLYGRACQRASSETDVAFGEFFKARILAGSSLNLKRLLSDHWYPDKIDDLFKPD